MKLITIRYFRKPLAYQKFGARLYKGYPLSEIPVQINVHLNKYYIALFVSDITYQLMTMMAGKLIHLITISKYTVCILCVLATLSELESNYQSQLEGGG